ncbi:MAG: flagellar export chaperone FliS [Pirellulales bacterium]|nr:flagellar export chaperone FliS [Pirellulales bacterium]
MQPTARDSYLTTQVMTATPQKLHLLLIDAALRQTRLAIEGWQSERDEEAGEAVIRAQQIVTELLSNLNPEADRNLARRLAGIYMFVFRSLVNAHLRREVQSAEDAVRILTEERQTWALVCEQLPEAPVRPQAAEQTSPAAPPQVAESPAAAAAPAAAPARPNWPAQSLAPGYGPFSMPSSQGLSLEG